MISQYNLPFNEKYGVKNLEIIFLRSITMQGFIVSQYLGTDIQNEFEKDFTEWIKAGKIVYREKVIDGIENIAEGFVNLFDGRNIGRTIVKVSDY